MRELSKEMDMTAYDCRLVVSPPVCRLALYKSYVYMRNKLCIEQISFNLDPVLLFQPLFESIVKDSFETLGFSS